MTTACRKRRDVVDYSRCQFIKRSSCCNSKDRRPHSKSKSMPFTLTLNLDRRDLLKTTNTESTLATQGRAPSSRGTPHSSRMVMSFATPERRPTSGLAKSASKAEIDTVSSYQLQYYIDKIFQLSQIIEQKDEEIDQLKGVIADLKREPTKCGRNNSCCSPVPKPKPKAASDWSRSSLPSRIPRNSSSKTKPKEAKRSANPRPKSPRKHLYNQSFSTVHKMMSSTESLNIKEILRGEETEGGLRDQLKTLRKKIETKLESAEQTVRQLMAVTTSSSPLALYKLRRSVLRQRRGPAKT